MYSLRYHDAHQFQAVRSTSLYFNIIGLFLSHLFPFFHYLQQSLVPESQFQVTPAQSIDAAIIIIIIIITVIVHTRVADNKIIFGEQHCSPLHL